MAKVLTLFLLFSQLVLASDGVAAAAATPDPTREGMQRLLTMARSLYDERPQVLLGGDYGIDFEWLNKDALTAPTFYTVTRLTTLREINAAVARGLFPAQVPLTKGRDHKQVAQLNRHAMQFASELAANWDLYDYYLLENWETGSDNWASASCGLAMTPKGEKAHAIMLGLQAVKI